MPERVSVTGVQQPWQLRPLWAWPATRVSFPSYQELLSIQGFSIVSAALRTLTNLSLVRLSSLFPLTRCFCPIPERYHMRRATQGTLATRTTNPNIGIPIPLYSMFANGGKRRSSRCSYMAAKDYFSGSRTLSQRGLYQGYSYRFVSHSDAQISIKRGHKTYPSIPTPERSTVSLVLLANDFQHL